MKKLYDLTWLKGDYTLLEFIKGLSLKPNRFVRSRSTLLYEIYSFYLTLEEVALIKIKYPSINILRNNKYY